VWTFRPTRYPPAMISVLKCTPLSCKYSGLAHSCIEIKNRARGCLFVTLLLALLTACSPKQGTNSQAYLKAAGLTIPSNAQLKTQACDYLPTGRSLAMLLSIDDSTVSSFIATNNLVKIQNSYYDLQAFPFPTSALVSQTTAAHWDISSSKLVSGYVIMSANGSGKTDVSIRFLLPEHSQ
jgi:hypothetical protein